MNHLVKKYLNEIEATRSAKTAKDYRLRLEAFGNFRDDLKWTRERAIEFLVGMKRANKGKASIAAHEGMIRQFYAWLVEDGSLPANPLGKRRIAPYHSNTRPTEFAFTGADWDKLQAYLASNPLANEHWLGVVMVAWHTGLRMGDIAGLQADTIDMASKVIRLTPRKTARYGRIAEVPLTPELIAYFEAHPFPEVGVVFQWAQRQYEKGFLSVRFAYLLQGAGIKGKSFHAFRHALISRLLSRGVAPVIVGSITGQSLQMIERYTHITLETKAREMEKLSA